MSVSLRPYQQTSVTDIRAEFRAGHHAVLFVLPTGGGKCLGRGTPVMKFDGTIVPVEDVRVGDQLMGPDSKPRTVVSLARGREMLYRVTPTKGDPYVVNESHILSLKRTATRSNPQYPCERRSGEIVNISVSEYLQKSKNWKHIHKGWRAPADFETRSKELPLPPYLLGAWLGDGTTGHCSLTTAETEISAEFEKYCAKNSMEVKVRQNSDWSVTLHLQGRKGRRFGRAGSPFGNALRQLGVFNDKHVPHQYLTASRKDRLELLAGIIDTDGSYTGKGFDLCLKSERLMDGVIFVARSLGFACYKSPIRKRCHNNGVEGDYFRCNISGDIDQVPCRLARKQAKPRRQKKSPLVTGITVEPIGEGEYFGFELSGPDRLFLLGDFTVTHNTYTFVYIGSEAGKRGNPVLILEHRKELIRQASLSLASLGVMHQVVAPPDKVAAIRRAHVQRFGRPFISDRANIAVASVQTLARRYRWLDEFRPKLIIIDEAHHATAGTWAKIIERADYAKLLGVTATPTRSDGQGLGRSAGGVFDAMVLGPSMAELIELGNLVPPRVFSPPPKIDLSGVHRSGGDYKASELADATDNATITGDAVEHYRKIAPGRPAIVFCVNVDHAKHVAEHFRQAGFRFEILIGDMDDAERDRRIEQLADGRLQGLVTVDVISEGTDIPVAEVAIMLRATESESLFLQQAGRVLRPCPEMGKTHGIILDHVGNVGRWEDGQFVLKHGMPDADREWTLEGAKKRGKSNKDDNEPVLRVLQCPKCYLAHDPRPECPGCGYKYEARVFNPPKQSDGELREIQADEAEQLRKEQRKRQGQAQTIDQLMALGMSRGRAEKILEAREEKARLRYELSTLLRQYQRRTGQHPADTLGFGPVDIPLMKPKQLKQSIEAVSDALFHAGSAGQQQQMTM